MNFYKDQCPTIETKNGDKINVNDVAVNSMAVPELVDSGAKNLAPKNSGETSGSGYFFQNQKSIMIPSGTEIVISFDYQTSDGQLSVQLTKSDTGIITNTITYTSSSSKSGHIEKHLTLTSDAYGYNAYYSGSGTASISNFMICTKAAWLVTQTYVPYRPSLETLYSRYPITVQNYASFSAANTWTYTGVTAQIPANKICLVVASMNYNVGKPLGICICNTIDPTKAGAVASTLAYFETTEEDMKMMVPTCMFVNPETSSGATTLYVHAKNSSTIGTSSVRLSMIYLN